MIHECLSRDTDRACTGDIGYRAAGRARIGTFQTRFDNGGFRCDPDYCALGRCIIPDDRCERFEELRGRVRNRGQIERVNNGGYY